MQPYPFVILSKANSTKLNPLPFSLYGGFSKNTVAGNVNLSLSFTLSHSNVLSIIIFDDPSPIRNIFKQARMYTFPNISIPRICSFFILLFLASRDTGSSTIFDSASLIISSIAATRNPADPIAQSHT